MVARMELAGQLCHVVEDVALVGHVQGLLRRQVLMPERWIDSQEVPEPVPEDAASERTPGLVVACGEQPHVADAGGRIRLQAIVLVESEQAPMQLVAPRARDDVDDSPEVPAVLRPEASRFDIDLLEEVHRQRGLEGPGARIRDVQTVHEVAVLRQRGSVDRRVSATVRYGSPPGGSARVHHSGSQIGQI